MERAITGFHPDAEGDWVAELDCWHNQHVRHRPPFQERPWVVQAATRAGWIGRRIECPLCDRAELPVGLTVARTAGPFDEDTLPGGLRRTHRLAERTWGRLVVQEGTVGLRLETSAPFAVRLRAGDCQAIPPRVDHQLETGGHFVIQIDFLTRAL